MIFLNDTRINIDTVAEKEGTVPIILGHNFYIDDQGYVCTFNRTSVSVYDKTGTEVKVTSFQPVTEFIYIVNQKIAYRTSTGFLVTDLVADKSKYRGGFQGIVGYDEAGITYEYMNANGTATSSVEFTARINNSKQLEIYLSAIDSWVVPLGEFRCFINDVLYTISYDTILPNSFGDTFTITLLGWTSVTISPDTNYIRDIFIQGNTLYLSTRLKIIGSTPYDWSSISTDIDTVIWSEDSRLTGGYFVGAPTASYFFIVNYQTSTIYWINASDFDITQEYTHKLPILGVGNIDKFTIGIVDKEAVNILSAYVSLNTWLIRSRLYYKFNQLSAYEDMVTDYLKEEVDFVQDLDALVIRSTQRASMMLYILNNKVLSGCHTEQDIIGGEYSAYHIEGSKVYKYTRVEDSGEYTEIDYDTGALEYTSSIYIGSDLEPDVGGSTMSDTEIKFEGKILIIDGEDVSVESSDDVPEHSADLPVRTNQVNSDNWWYLYTKTLRYPISYSDWTEIGLMPTTKIFNISLVKPLSEQNNKRR